VADTIKLSAAVIHVRELQQSTDFYREVLLLDVEVTSAEASLLTAPGGDHRVLRVLPNANRAFGVVGVQFLVWTPATATTSIDVLASSRLVDAFVSVSTEQGAKVVEGRDPDGIPVVVVYPARPGIGMTAVPARSYAY